MEEAPNRLSAHPCRPSLFFVASTAAAHGPSRYPESPRAGQDLYERHCAVCHGLDGGRRAAGPMAPVLIVQPFRPHEP